MFSVVIISLSLKYSIFLIMKAVSAQCLTVGNPKSTVKEITYNHSTQKPQLTPSIWIHCLSIVLRFLLRSAHPQLYKKV